MTQLVQLKISYSGDFEGVSIQRYHMGLECKVFQSIYFKEEL